MLIVAHTIARIDASVAVRWTTLEVGKSRLAAGAVAALAAALLLTIVKRNFKIQGGSTMSCGPVIVTPSVDSRSYAHLSLPNGLEAVLVHDAEADKAAAALDVRSQRWRVVVA